MNNRYFDLIDQTFDWPTQQFDLQENNLTYFNLPLMNVIQKYGTPLRITFIPRIGEKIEEARSWFNKAFNEIDYPGSYEYAYCTKSSHFSFVMKEVLSYGASIETSSNYDIDIIRNLDKKGVFDKKTKILCNGFKPPLYIENIVDLIERGYKAIPILDNLQELNEYLAKIKKEIEVGIRIATEEEPNFEFYTSRLGIRYNDILELYQNQIQNNESVKLKMLHFFVNSGIRDNQYYWNELRKCVNVYCDLKEHCPDLDILDIGGGFPVPNNLGFNFDYYFMIREILYYIKTICDERSVKCPNIITEFGNYKIGRAHV